MRLRPAFEIGPSLRLGPPRRREPAAQAKGFARHLPLGATGGPPVPSPLVATNQRPVQYKGADLDPDKGPGLGCFRFQLVVLAFFIVITPLTVVWQWPSWISAGLLFGIIVLLLITGQTIIFLLRLVAADRRSRRRPLASGTRTVGELEDEGSSATPPDEGPMRQ